MVDFDGDGKKDLLFVTPTASYLYLFKNANGYSFNEGQKLTYPTLNDNDQIYLGDFNGDGKTDILTHLKNGVSVPTGVIIPSNYYQNPVGNKALSSSININSGSWAKDDFWNIGYSTGYNFNQQAFLENKFTVNVLPGSFTDINTAVTGKMQSSDGTVITFSTFADYQKAINSSQQFVISDFNGDGKSDVLYSAIPMAPVPGNPFPGISWDYTSPSYNDKLYYSQGNQFVVTAVGNLNLSLGDFFTIGDFNGDGRTDFAHYPIVPNWSVGASFGNSLADFNEYFFNPNAQERLLQKVSDGFNQVTSFTYKPLTDPTVHTRGANNTYPLISAQMPLYVLSSLVLPDGIGGININSYNYSNALVVHNGIGFIGFGSATSHSSATKTTVITTQSGGYLLPYYRPVEILQSVSTGGQLISTSSSEYHQGMLGINRSFYCKTSDLKLDNLSGNLFFTFYGYDNYGNINSASGYSPTETSVVRTTYGQYGPCTYPSKPMQICSSTTRNGQPSNIVTTNYHYYYTGAVSAQVPVAACAPTTWLNYDGFGNLKSKTKGALVGFNKRTETYSYNDGFGRSLVGTVNTLGQAVTITTDVNWGKPVSIKSVDGNTSYFSYDAYGRIVSAISPMQDFFGGLTTASYSWDINNQVNSIATHSVFRITTSTTGGPTTNLWKDALGREVQRQTMGFGGNWLTSNITYYNFNKVQFASKPSYNGEAAITNTYTYDNLLRPSVITDQLSHTTNFTYSYSGGNLTTSTALEPSGRHSSQITDAGGKILSASDAGGTLNYTYDSYGNKLDVKNSFGASILSYKYDACNNQLSQVEVNSGTYTYAYDLFGEVTQQSDLLGVNRQPKVNC